MRLENRGRSERIRTSDPCLPKAVLYQAELHSESVGSVDREFGQNDQSLFIR